MCGGLADEYANSRGAKMIDVQLINGFIEDFYKNMDHVRLNQWNYEDGCILLAAIQLYQATGKKLYRDYVVTYLNAYVNDDGSINTYNLDEFNLDNIAPGRALIFAYEQTGEEKYLMAAKVLLIQIGQQPRTESGNFWHKKIYDNQVWLDGLYMAQPFYMAFDTKFGKKEKYPDIVKQFGQVREHMYDSKAKLYYHGWDETESIFWANKPGGCSKNFWLRSAAWYQMAIIDTMEEMSMAIYEHYRSLGDVFKESLIGLLQYQDSESGLFYQLTTLAEQEGNYLETSGSAMIAAAIFKACRMRVILPEKYQKHAERILEGLMERKLVVANGTYQLKDINQVAGLGPKDNLRRDGSIEYYLSEPVISNDNKGLAAFFMAYAQYLLLTK